MQLRRHKRQHCLGIGHGGKTPRLDFLPRGVDVRAVRREAAQPSHQSAYVPRGEDAHGIDAAQLEITAEAFHGGGKRGFVVSREFYAAPGSAGADAKPAVAGVGKSVRLAHLRHRRGGFHR